jgi:alcohol dehydrogenase class IV
MSFRTMQAGDNPMRFEFATAARILFGPGTLREVAPAAVGLGQRVLVVTGRTPERAKPLLDHLDSLKVLAFTFPVGGEPTLDTVRSGVEKARETACEAVIGVGGGSVIDAGKAIAALLTNGGNLLDYLEVIGKGQPLAQPPAPYIAVPTTAGTGAEVTRNAVLTSVDHRVKVSLRSPMMLPRLAVVDPELTTSLPPHLTAGTGLDALTQVIEPYVGNNPNPLTDALCREGMQRAAGALRRAYRDGNDSQARNDMALASLIGGLVLANARLGAVHGLAGPLGGMFPAPHGMICARLLPLVMEANVRALERRTPGSPALARFAETARILTGELTATIDDGLAWLHALGADLAVPPLSRFGLSGHDLPQAASQAMKASSMRGNPIELEEQELTDILYRAL